MTHVMVDLETMGTRAGSVIASIGAVAFDPQAGTISASFYRAISLISCEDAGLTFDADTVNFWLKQSDEARAALRKNEVTLGQALDAFAYFWRSVSGSTFWSHGANFDEPLLNAAYRALRMRVPWPYYASRCTRTIYDLADVKPDRAAGVHHNALDDARAQAEAVIRAYAKLFPAPVELPATDEGLAAMSRRLWAERQADCAKFGADLPMPTMAVPVDRLAGLLDWVEPPPIVIVDVVNAPCRVCGTEALLNDDRRCLPCYDAGKEASETLPQAVTA